MRNLKQNTAANVMVLLVDSTDHITGKTGLTLTITASKDGAAFATITPTVTARGDGWYNLALSAVHTNTPGDLALHVVAAGADPSDVLYSVDDMLVEKILRNKMITDPATGVLTVFDDDGTTPLLTGTVYKDAAGTTTYNGTGAERRERLT